MARQIVWTQQAQNERKQILAYWTSRNRSNLHSKKLSRLFTDALKIIVERPFIGKRTSIENVRIKVVRDYLIFYEITEIHIVVLTIRDCRRNPLNIQL
ncbi:type II toxin-antitoxin system RelE/ParE family toxin [Mangrovibacterium marinum]|uniref:Toxin YoeB n=1 Tax=Mangrovibacterium marinum TaxID=1639118 RepID=A0A2T5C1B9_9BACT|nr:toxin YoeB [Mangrovibacterium marinum]